jgi:mannose-6-phosphate isomerase-like protein (cupin superfamily)
MNPADAIDKTKTAAVLLPGDGERINVIGNSQTIKLDGQMTNGLFAMIEQNNKEGAGVPLHVHTREDETLYVCEGEVLFRVGEIEILAPTGTTVYLPRGSSSRLSREQTDACVAGRLPGGSRKNVSQIKRIAARPAEYGESHRDLCRVRYLLPVAQTA